MKLWVLMLSMCIFTFCQVFWERLISFFTKSAQLNKKLNIPISIGQNPVISIQLPHVISSLQVVTLGHSASFCCGVTGIPSPVVEWFLNGVKLNNSGQNNDQRERDALNSTLVLPRVTLDDLGSYTCKASNAHGSHQSNPALLELFGEVLVRWISLAWADVFCFKFGGDGWKSFSVIVIQGLNVPIFVKNLVNKTLLDITSKFFH